MTKRNGFTVVDLLVLQRYKGSSKLMRPADNSLQINDLSGGIRYGRQHDFEDQTTVDTIFASI